VVRLRSQPYYIHGKKPQNSGVGGWWGTNTALDSLEKKKADLALPGIES
jgi:hypothetical protein